jgi:hypothetical protein
MNILFICMLFLGQVSMGQLNTDQPDNGRKNTGQVSTGEVNAGKMNTLQSKQIVHLPPHGMTIRYSFGGKMLVLLDAPAAISLPPDLPKQDAQGIPWSVDIKNLGPRAVTVIGNPKFSLLVHVNETVHISSNGEMYFRTW